MRVLGVDLAWGEGTAAKPANETGVVAVEADGTILDAGWTVGIDATAAWMTAWSTDATLAMVDASLVVTNPTGLRACERQVGQRYGRWKVSANATNLASPRQGGATLLRRLEAEGWRYDVGSAGPPRSGRVVSECYPYTTLVGAPELGFALERPRYKRKPTSMRVAEFRPLRAAVCDQIIDALVGLAEADPPLHITSHPVTARLASSPSPLADREYKHREDLIDATICAWTGLLWLAHGLARCQVLHDPDERQRPAGIIAPARPEQRRT